MSITIIAKKYMFYVSTHDFTFSSGDIVKKTQFAHSNNVRVTATINGNELEIDKISKNIMC